jgi:hypothetical protein
MRGSIDMKEIADSVERILDDHESLIDDFLHFVSERLINCSGRDGGF